MALSESTDEFIQNTSKIGAVLLASFGFICLRAWLVSICAGLLFPGLVLSFWNWALIVATFRFVIATDSFK